MHDTNNDYWNFTSVDLSGLTGNGTLRFNYTRTSTDFTSDIALDRINVTYFADSESSFTQKNLLSNNSWANITTNFGYLNNISFWMWADYECNYTTWKLWEPGLLFRNCCNNCTCSEDLI